MRSQTEFGNEIQIHSTPSGSQTLFGNPAAPATLLPLESFLMRTRYKVYDPSATYFVTSTIVAWLPVFTTAATCDILVESLAYCRQHKGLSLFGWVILDNHFHAVVAAPELTRVLADLKKFTARRLLDQVKQEGREWLLNQFEYYRAHHKTASDYQVWQEGFHPQQIEGNAMMEQKLEYNHNNPVRRGLVAAPEHWRYSSAHEWLVGAQPVMRCDPWR
jgi:REP element-mobilizing transposase RayT